MGKDVGTNKLKLLKAVGYSTPHKERNAEVQRQQMCVVVPRLDLNAARPASPEFEKAFLIIKAEVATFGRKPAPTRPLARPPLSCPTAIHAHLRRPTGRWWVASRSAPGQNCRGLGWPLP